MRKRPQDQTTEEWLDEYNYYCNLYWGSGKYTPPNDTTSVIDPPHSTNETIDKGNLQFRYVTHRTFVKYSGNVALDFESLDGTITATAFFNVKLQSTHGNKYSTGEKGQFIPPGRGEFYKFWMQAVGKPPPNGWSRTHKAMRSHLKDIVFTGELISENDSNGRPYFKLKKVKAI